MRASTSAVNAKIIFGVYNLNSSGYPNTLLFQTSELLGSLTSRQTLNISYTFSAGTYFVAYNVNNGTPNYVGGPRNNVYNTVLPTSDLNSGTLFLPNGLQVSSTYSVTLPSTFPTGAISTGVANFVFIWFIIS